MIDLKEFIIVANECRKHMLELPMRGSEVCSNYETYEQVHISENGHDIRIPMCAKCGMDRYSHLCKKILGLGFEFK